MVVVIHQPLFLPWLGYLHRMAQADLFVLLDHVQFERASYQNRTRIGMEGTVRWITVPVIQRSQKERIADKEIDNRRDGARWWAPNHFRTLRQAYRDAGHFDDYAVELKSILERRWERLVELDLAALDFMRQAFGIRTPIILSSQLDVVREERQGLRGELALDICREVGATRLLAGVGTGSRYLDADAFADADIEIGRHEFEHPVDPQRGAAEFMPGLSALDLLFNCGPESRKILAGEAEALV
jgi:hypothetical protein